MSLYNNIIGKAKGFAEKRAVRIAATTILASATGMLISDVAMAGADTTFSSVATKVAGIIAGSGGTLATGAAVGKQVMNGVLEFNAGLCVKPICVGLLAGFGTTIAGGMVTALI
ncbi:hypothetical protein [Nitrospirillum amazonense]|uniref:hypothetical protein n=1 Tax=Nitrospirillum amazonense TaxID=28077 RepID=UPI002412E06E|nr:hypothetical protein [Nitrospirillum amazonense]MDG3444530.1 hypothetical protein [Nitrospirillum amazonense]